MTKLLLSVTLLASGSLFANTWYLATDGNDDYDGTSSNFVSGTVGPKQSFESLMPSVGANDTIVLMPGEHCYGSMTPSAGGNHTLSRAHIAKSGVTIRSYSGNPADTAIVGWGVESPDSLGDDKQIRCISIYKNATGCVIDGLTLKNGVACMNGDASAGRGLGGGVFDESKSCWLIGCVVTNCMAYGGGGVYGANTARTRFIGCKGARTAYGAAMYLGGTAAFCLFDRCEDVKTGARTLGGDNATTKVYNCTFVGAKRGVFYCKNTSEGFTVVNSISVGNIDSTTAADSVVGDAKITARRSVFTACTGTNADSTYTDCRTGVTLAEAGFCNAAAGDWRVSVSSPAATMGDAAELSAVTLPAGYEHKDLYGNPVPASGTIAAGCALAAPCIVLGKGVSDAAGALSEGANDLPFEQASSYTFSVNANAFVRPVAGLSVNGEPIAGDDPWTVTIGSLALGKLVEVSAVIGTNWYVNVNGGDDGNNGGSPLRAKHSIRAATTNAVPGDVVHVAEGVYDAASEGEQTRGTHKLPQRVVVPKDVVVVADGRAEHTVICGAASPQGDAEDDYGNGVGAVRCAYVAPGATLRNFTLTAGHTRYTATTVDADQKGGAVLGGGVESVVADCIVTGNCAFSATLYIVRADRCIVKANTAANSPAGETCSWYSCLFDDNVGSRMIYGPKIINSCTIGSGNVDMDGSSDIILVRTQTQYPFAMTNCVMTTGRTYGPIYAKDCAFPKALSTAANITAVDCHYLDADEMPTKADGYVPSAASRLNNAGNMSLVSGDPGEVDLAGVPRVLNGGVDIGAFEHDWRVDYSSLLGSRRMQVSEASPTVVAQDAAISLNGGELAGSFVVAEPVRLRFAVSGDGALKLYVKDVLVGTYEAGPNTQEVVLNDVAAHDGFRFEHVLAPGEAGSAMVFHCAGTSGLMLFLK